MIVGVLALQGDFAKHEEVLCSLGVTPKQVRKPDDLQDCAGLIIPGGESTALFRQIEFIKLREPLLEFAKQMPIFGTCAGLILMAKEIEESNRKPLGLLDVTIERNAFGRQVDSFATPIAIELRQGHPVRFDAFFIRAPKIKSWGPEVELLAEFEGKPVMVRQGKFLGSCFHPELTNNPLVHDYFIKLL